MIVTEGGRFGGYGLFLSKGELGSRSCRYIRLAGGDLAGVPPAQTCPHTVRGAKAPS
jgi:hypothetical protein